MSNQAPFNSLLTGLPPTVTTTKKRHSVQESSDIDLLGITGLQETKVEVKSHQGVESSFAPLNDQFAHNVAIFPKTDRVKITKDGVYIPQKMLGENVEIKHEEKYFPNGNVQIIISSSPRERTAKTREVKIINCTLELAWLDEYRDDYVGQWVALKGNQLLSHGENARTVYEAARELGIESPVLIQVEAEEELPFGGW